MEHFRGHGWRCGWFSVSALWFYLWLHLRNANLANERVRGVAKEKHWKPLSWKHEGIIPPDASCPWVISARDPLFAAGTPWEPVFKTRRPQPGRPTPHTTCLLTSLGITSRVLRLVGTEGELGLTGTLDTPQGKRRGSMAKK